MRQKVLQRLLVTLVLAGLSAVTLAFWRVPLGIDLAGGAEMLYRLDDVELRREKEQYERLLQELQEPALRQKKQRELETLKGQRAAETEPMRQALLDSQITARQLELNEKELLNRIEGIEGQVSGESTKQAADIIRRRINPGGIREVLVTQMGESRIRVQIPFRVRRGEDPKAAEEQFNRNVEDVNATIQRTGVLSFHLVLEDREKHAEALEKFKQREPLPAGVMLALPMDEYRKAASELDAQGRTLPRGYLELREGEKPLLLREDHMGLTGGILGNASVGFGERGPEVSFVLTPHGSGLFEEVTGKNVGRQLAILLDGVVQSAPVIEERISGRGRITGSYTDAEAWQVATVLRSGRLPMKLQFESLVVVGPSLGRDSIEKGLRSIAIGGAMVVLFMVFYYRAVGLVSVLAVLLNLLLVLGAMGTTEATLTLPGLAGILLTIGMSVDASVLIYERIREERSRGRPLDKSVEAGFDRAFVTIVDANLTTIIAAIVLYWFGTGPIRGFAVTLTMGIAASMFTALYVSRFIIEGLVHYGWVKELRMMQLVREPRMPFMRLRGPAFALSLAAVAGGLVAFFAYKDKYGVDFMGGTLFQVRFAEGVDVAIEEVRKAIETQVQQVAVEADLDSAGHVTVQSFESGFLAGGGVSASARQFTVTTQLAGEQVERLKARLKEHYGAALAAEPFSRTESIGPNVAAELGRAAFLSIGAALLLIFFYIVLRFDFSAAFGAGAVVALFHDVAVAVGAIVAVDWLRLVEVKIDLPIVAALLTIVGYSLNDTIVVYDRIRENRRNYPGMPLAAVVDASINQTLSRTLLTSLTTLLAVLALFLFGGGVVHGFSFVLLVGVVTGTYSSIFVAAPLVVQFYGRGTEGQKKEPKPEKKSKRR